MVIVQHSSSHGKLAHYSKNAFAAISGVQFTSLILRSFLHCPHNLLNIGMFRLCPSIRDGNLSGLYLQEQCSVKVLQTVWNLKEKWKPQRLFEAELVLETWLGFAMNMQVVVLYATSRGKSLTQCTAAVVGIGGLEMLQWDLCKSSNASLLLFC